MIIAATEAAGEQLIGIIASALLNNARLAEDFPEVTHCVRKLEGDARRAAGQTLDGVRTCIGWTKRRIVFPTVAGAATSGSILSAAGLGGRIRGQVHSLSDGTIIRPDFALIDDPQTRESAHSDEQCNDRLNLIHSDVLGLSGPGKAIAAAAALTVIRAGDLSDRLLSRKEFPHWQGERASLMRAMPANKPLSERYREILEDCLRADAPTTPATEFYREHREEMDAGAEAAWPERFNPDEISAVQNAMNLRLRDEAAFMSEFQNQPLVDERQAAALKPEQVAAKISGLPRGTPPTKATKITAFIDVHAELLYFAVVAWDEDFGGSVLDYGAYPDPGRPYYTLREISDSGNTLSKILPGATREGAILAGLKTLIVTILDRAFTSEAGGQMHVDRMLIDSGYLPDVVTQAIRQTGKFGIAMPSRGVGVGAANKPFSEYARRPGEQLGGNWLVTAAAGMVLRVCRFDSNAWKSFVNDRLAAPLGNKGSFSLFGDSPKPHRMIGEHLTAETGIVTTGQGRTLREWRPMPGRDNHLLDCIVGAAVAASLCGVGLPPRPAPPPRGPRKFRVL